MATESERIDEEMRIRDLLANLSEKTKNRYALDYIQNVFRHNLWGDDLVTQCKYILFNLKGWRGEEARQGKVMLNDYIEKYTGLPFFQGPTYQKKNV